MKKLIELGVAIDTAIDAADEWDCDFSFERDRKIRDAFMALPTVDAVPVVRCRDCKNSEHWYADRRRCFLWHENGVSVFDGGFCNYGERKDGEQA